MSVKILQTHLTEYIHKYLKLTPGDDLRKPPTIIMAPTANAAYIVGGKTIESALGMLPSKMNSFLNRNPTSN